MSHPSEKKCFDPSKRHKKAQRKDVRVVPYSIIQRHPTLGLTRQHYLCTVCRKELQAVADTNMEDLENTGVDLDGMQATSVDVTETGDVEESTQSSESESVESSVEISLDEEADSRDYSALDGEEMIEQLKRKFSSSVSRSEKLTILTVLPQRWSLRKTSAVFGVSRYLARRAKLLVAEKGVLSSPNAQHTNALSLQTGEAVNNFYLSDELSRVMPGRKDFVSVLGADGNRQHMQKRLLLCNLKEAYTEWKNRHPELKVGFSKFASLRPRECILAGASGTHSVCVCTIHQNVKLMMIGSKLESLSGGELKHYNSCLAKLHCNPPSLNCIFGSCETCPGTEPLCKLLQAMACENSIDTVEVRQWTQTDRANLETKVMLFDDFIDVFISMLKKLTVHDFTAKMQARYVQECKDNLVEGEYLIIADFSENYSFVVQDEIQSFHWNNRSATVHPFVCYFKEQGELHHLCFVIISESTQHDVIAVHLFQKKLIEFLKGEGKRLQKMIYFSDGCAAQYKNCKNFLNLCLHLVDFGVPAEWHFFATSHGKSAGDGAGGTLKRLATKASLQHAYQDHILTAHELYQFAVNHIKGMRFCFVALGEHEQEAKLLDGRLARSRTVPGTQKLHCFIPISPNTLEVKLFSSSTVSRRERVEVGSEPVLTPQATAIGGYVTVAYVGECWLGCVVGANTSEHVITVTFLHPCIPASSFVYPEQEDVLDVDLSDVLTSVNATTATGRTYSLTRKEMQEASAALRARFV